MELVHQCIIRVTIIFVASNIAAAECQEKLHSDGMITRNCIEYND